MRSQLLFPVTAPVCLVVELVACESDDPMAPELGAITIDNDLEVGPTLDATGERPLHERRFSKQNVTDPNGSLVPGIQSIPNAERASVFVDYRLERGGMCSVLD